jgi:outer membrane murein-binding lipoprotein Lpp
MTRSIRERRTRSSAWRKTVLVAVVVATTALGLTGCSAINKAANAVKAVHNLVHGSAAIDQLTSKMQSSDTSAYDVTYVTTGSAPATVRFAVDPPHDFAFDDTTSTGEFQVLGGAAGVFECSRSSSGSSSAGAWSCVKAQGAEVDTDKLAYALYSGSYWIDFLKIYSVAAALHGVTISSATMSVNGFNLQCAVVVSGSKPNEQTSEVCVTSQGILGYVSVSARSADFEIQSFSPSPPASLFQIPAGATVSTLPTPTTS